MKDMESLGSYAVWLKGSRKYIRRTVYYHKAMRIYLVKYGGNWIEVKPGCMEYYTVSQY